MAFKVAALLSTFSLIYLIAPLVTSDMPNSYRISLVVYNSLTHEKNLTFYTDIAYRGILLGAMKRIQTDYDNFNFTTEENQDYGPFLVSVNGLAGNSDDHTYWQLLATLTNGTTIIPDVGVGCYIPNPDDTVILKFTKWSSSSEHTEATNGLRAHDWHNDREDL